MNSIIVRLWALIILQLLAAVAYAQVPQVRYSLAFYAPGSTTQPINSIKAGQDFDLVLLVQDLRADGEFIKWDGSTQQLRRGVFAAYVDVFYVNRYAAFRSVAFSAPYGNGRHCDVATPSKLGALGAFCTFEVAGTAMREVARVRFTALWPSTIPSSLSESSTQFVLSAVNLDHPKYLTLLIGNLDANPPEKTDDGVPLNQIITSGALLTITKQ